MLTNPRRFVFVALVASAFSLSGAFACGGGSTGAPVAPAGDAAVSDSAATDSTPNDSRAPRDGATSDATFTLDSAGHGDAAKTSDAAAQEQLICDALASRSACSGGAIACTDDVKCIYGQVMLPDAAAAFASCRGAPSCKSDDACGDAAGWSVGGAAATQYTTDCVARRSACSNSFGDDYCGVILFAYPGAAAGAQACLAQPCNDIAACMSQLQAVKDIAACK